MAVRARGHTHRRAEWEAGTSARLGRSGRGEGLDRPNIDARVMTWRWAG